MGTLHNMFYCYMRLCTMSIVFGNKLSLENSSHVLRDVSTIMHSNIKLANT